MEFYSINPILHKSKFKRFDLDDKENQEVLEHLIVFFDGTIVGVNKEAVKEYFKMPDVRRVRMGYEKLPETIESEFEEDGKEFVRYRPRLADVTTKEEFFKELAYIVPL